MFECNFISFQRDLSTKWRHAAYFLIHFIFLLIYPHYSALFELFQPNELFKKLNLQTETRREQQKSTTSNIKSQIKREKNYYKKQFLYSISTGSQTHISIESTRLIWGFLGLRIYRNHIIEINAWVQGSGVRVWWGRQISAHRTVRVGLLHRKVWPNNRGLL